MGIWDRTSPEVLAKARKLYEQDIKLKALREKYGIRQTDIAKSSQTAVSKLERRKDMRISTLITSKVWAWGLKYPPCRRGAAKK